MSYPLAQITGVAVRETVPDSVFDKAHDVRLVDLPVDSIAPLSIPTVRYSAPC